MARIFKISSLLILISFFAYAGETATLIIEVNGFKNDTGILHSHLFNDSIPELFPTKSNLAFRKQTVKINLEKTVIIYENIPYGKYAATVHQDYDENFKMDRNFIGYPSEPFGLSNNPTLILSIPHFDKCDFEVNQPKVLIEIKLKFV